MMFYFMKMEEPNLKLACLFNHSLLAGDGPELQGLFNKNFSIKILRNRLNITLDADRII